MQRPQLIFSLFSLFSAVQSVGELLCGVELVGSQRVGEGVALAQLEVVEVARRDVERGFEVVVFVGEEPGVEAVEQDRLIACVGDQVFPRVIAQLWGYR